MRYLSGVPSIVARRMSSQGKSWSDARAVCPRPEHAGSRVRFDGRYGPPEHQRQLYKCVPANGDPAHRFTEPRPREESWNEACELCERDVHVYEGPHAARNYQFVARGIAEALVMVGGGSTYRDAALVARERAKRLRAGPDGVPRFSRHGSLVMDWVEVFAPVVFEPYRPRAWPTSGSLLLDDVPFRVRDPKTGSTRIAFRIFAATGYEAGRAKLWRLEAFTSKSETDWKAFLGALPGAPPRVVCDNDHGLTNAVGARFPHAELYLCEWHLRHALERLMRKIRSEEPEHREAIDELVDDLEAAFTGPSFWTPFTERCRAAGTPRVSEWLNTTGRIVADQFQPAWAARQPAGGHAALDLAAGRVHQPDPRCDRAARLRTEEPRADQPVADAHAATRQPPRRRARLRPAHPGLAGGQPRPSRYPSTGGRRCRRLCIASMTRSHQPGIASDRDNLAIRMLCEMRLGDAGYHFGRWS
jgi:hypothetical protein